MASASRWGHSDVRCARIVQLDRAWDVSEVDLVSDFTRDVTGIGHHGTGSLEVRLRSEKDLERAGSPSQLAYSAA